MAEIANLVDVLGNDFIKKDGSKIPELDYLNNDDVVVVLYFSAHWCPPCRVATPLLISMYNEIIANGKKLEIIFLSFDQNEEQFTEYVESMPWICLPFTQTDKRNQLMQKFGVRGIPSIQVLNKKGNPVFEDAVSHFFMNKKKHNDVFTAWKSAVEQNK